MAQRYCHGGRRGWITLSRGAVKGGSCREEGAPHLLASCQTRRKSIGQTIKPARIYFKTCHDAASQVGFMPCCPVDEGADSHDPGTELKHSMADRAKGADSPASLCADAPPHAKPIATMSHMLMDNIVPRGQAILFAIPGQGGAYSCTKVQRTICSDPRRRPKTSKEEFSDRLEDTTSERWAESLVRASARSKVHIS